MLSDLDLNEMEYIEEEDMEAMTSLRNLRVEGNRIRSVPTEALQRLHSLEVLYVGFGSFYVSLDHVAFMLQKPREQ